VPIQGSISPDFLICLEDGNQVSTASSGVAANDDPTISPELRLRAAIGLAAYQHPEPTPPRAETFVGPIDYSAQPTLEEARQAILGLGERMAKREISVAAHNAPVGGLRACLGRTPL
jgi:hypothetical protein